MSSDKTQIDDDTAGNGLQGYFDDLLTSTSASLNMVGGIDHSAEPLPAKSAPVAPQAKQASKVRKYHDTHRPHWAQQQFDAIIICSRGHHFVVPLQELLSVGLLSGAQASQFYDTEALSINTGGGDGPAHIAHIAKLLLLEEYQGESPERLAYLLVLKDSSWGLAVDSVSDRLQVDPDAVHWQMDRGNRPWLAGSLFESHYPLLDLRQLLPVLARLTPRQ
jgi:hypothetical protein